MLAALTTSAWFTDHHDTPYSRATSQAARPDRDTDRSRCCRNRRVKRLPAPICALVSANVRRRQGFSRHAHRRWSHHNRTGRAPCGTSLTRRSLWACTFVDSAPQSRHASWDWTPSTTTVRTAVSCSCSRVTVTTRNPSRPNNSVVASPMIVAPVMADSTPTTLRSHEPLRPHDAPITLHREEPVKVLTAGRSTRRSRSQATAPSNNAFGPPPLVHARSCSHRTSSSCIPANSTNP
jgi:hypothetical protein